MAISRIQENTKKYGKGQSASIPCTIVAGRITGSGNYLDFNLPINVQDDVSNIAIRYGYFSATFSDNAILTSTDLDLEHAYPVANQKENVCIEVPILSTQQMNSPVTVYLRSVTLVFS